MILVLPKDLKSLKVKDKVKVVLPRAECVFIVDEIEQHCLHHYENNVGIHAYFNEKHPLIVEVL